MLKLLPGRRYIDHAVLIGRTVNSLPYIAIAQKEPLRTEEDGDLVRIIGDESDDEFLVSQIKSFEMTDSEFNNIKGEKKKARLTVAGNGHDFWRYFDAFEENGPIGLADELRYTDEPNMVHTGYLMNGEFNIGILCKAIKKNCIHLPMALNDIRGAYVLADYNLERPLETKIMQTFERIGHKFIMRSEMDAESMVRGIEQVFGKEFYIGALMVKRHDKVDYSISLD